MHIKNFHHHDLLIDEFVTTPGQSWCVFGENHSGIDRFIELLSGKLTIYSSDILDLPKAPGIVSFRVQQELYEDEIRNDDSDFLDKPDPGTLVRDFLPGDPDGHLALLDTFAMGHCLDLGYRQLSSGQARKLLILCQLAQGVATLILENPYDGLDEQSCQELNRILMHLPESNVEVVISVTTLSDSPPGCSHLAIIKNGRMVLAGPKASVLSEKSRATDDGNAWVLPVADIFRNPLSRDARQGKELVFLRNGFAGYDGKLLFEHLDLTILQGDHSLITGPNGCGKSTLLDIITGDNPKCYANKLRIFGQARGSGESIWEIKKDMGIVSPSLHREHRVPGSALQVVVSGLFDSIGLYQRVTNAEIRTARSWLTWIGLASRADTPFRHLSFADQRLVLIARALIKGPKLLILDEPTQGLDDANRHALLNLLEEIADHHVSTMLFVSHRKDEHRPFFRQHIHLDAYTA
jgi:molybdate transport system ATP-binding protein